MQDYTVTSNNERFQFKLIHNLAYPCPVCGVPACGKDDVMWFEVQNTRVGIVYDGALLDVAIDTYFEQSDLPIGQSQHPEFLEEAAACTGWDECWDYSGHRLKKKDFDSALRRLTKTDFKELSGRISEMLSGMRELLEASREHRSPLKVTRG